MRDAGIQMTKTYAGRENMYPKYENKDAIEIGHKTLSGKWEGSLDEIPYDYDGENWKTYNGTDWVICDTPDIFN